MRSTFMYVAIFQLFNMKKGTKMQNYISGRFEYKSNKMDLSTSNPKLITFRNGNRWNSKKFDFCHDMFSAKKAMNGVSKMISAGGGFKDFFFTLTWGNDPFWLLFFRWVETTN